MTQMNQSDLLEYRTNLLQALEELKYRRTECKDLHSRVEKLLANNLQAGQNLEAKTLKLKNAQQREEQLRQDLKQASATSSEEKWRQENQKLREAVEFADKTVVGLKKELSMMSLSRHHLEINLKQAEQKVASRETSTNAVIERLRSIEATTEKLSKQLEESESAQALLIKNVEASKSLNRELERSFAHGNCLLNECKRERDELREKLLQQESKYRIVQHSGQSEDKEKIIQKEAENLRGKLKYIEEQNTLKSRIIEDLRTKLVEVENAAVNAHKIAERSTGDDKNVIEIEKKLESSEKNCKDSENKYQELLVQIKKVKNENETQISELKTKFKICEDCSAEEIRNLRSNLDEANNRIKKSNIELEKQDKIQKEMQELKVLYDSAVNDKRIAQEEVARLTDKITVLRDELNESKKEAENIMRPDCNDQESQTDVEVASANVQCDMSHMRTVATPTLLDLCSATEEKGIEINDKKLQEFDGTAIPSNMQVPEKLESSTKIDSQNSANDQQNFVTFSNLQVAASTEQPANSVEESKILEETFVAKHNVPVNLNDTSISNPSSKTDTTQGEITKVPLKEKAQKSPVSLRGSQRLSHDVASQGEEEPRDINVCFDLNSLKYLPTAIENSPVLTAVHGDLLPSKRENIVLRRSLCKKRKLSSTPPMLDASQSTQREYPADSEFYSKQASLKSLKNFTKLVLSNKPHPKHPVNRFRPLDLASETNLENPLYDENAFYSDDRIINRKPKVPISDKILTNRPYTDSSVFAKEYTSLRDRLASRFDGLPPKESPEQNFSLNRFPVGTSGSISMGFQSKKRQEIVGIIPASDEDEALIEVCESDDSI